jgi:hypothetical protein
MLLEAIAIGRRFGNPDIEFEALSHLGGLYIMVDRVEEGLVFFDEALAAACAGELTDLSTVDSMFCGFFWACELVNDVPRADQWMRAAVEVMRRRNVVAAFCRAHYGGILTAAGRWTEAETELVEAARHFDRGMPERRRRHHPPRGPACPARPPRGGRPAADRHGRVTGIRSHGKDGQTVTEHARVVVGADGRHSLVARAVGAERYHEKPQLLCGYYSCWSGLEMDGRFETYVRPDGGARPRPLTHVTGAPGGWSCRARTMQRKPRWEVEVSTAWAMRAAGR